MTICPTLADIQKATGCENVSTFGEACSIHSGGWWCCYCEMVARKKMDAGVGEYPPQEK